MIREILVILAANTSEMMIAVALKKITTLPLCECHHYCTCECVLQSLAPHPLPHPLSFVLMVWFLACVHE